MTKIIIFIALGVILLVGIILWFIFKRNYFNKYKYVRLVRYNDDKSISIHYIKRDRFNENGEILINPDHVFMYRGYTSIITTSGASESINPLNFDSKFSAKDYKSGMRSKLVKDAFDSVKADRFDKVMVLLVISIIQLLAIAYLVYQVIQGGK